LEVDVIPSATKFGEGYALHHTRLPRSEFTETATWRPKTTKLGKNKVFTYTKIVGNLENYRHICIRHNFILIS